MNQVCVVMSHQAKWFRSQSTSLCNIKESNLNECTRQRTSTKRNSWLCTGGSALFMFRSSFVSSKLNTFRLSLAMHPHRSVRTICQRFSFAASTRHKSWVECSTNHMLPIHWFGNNLIMKWTTERRKKWHSTQLEELRMCISETAPKLGSVKHQK